MKHHWQDLVQWAKVYRRRYYPLVYIVTLVAIAQIVHFGLLTMGSAFSRPEQEEQTVQSDNATNKTVDIAVSQKLTADEQELLDSQVFKEAHPKDQVVQNDNASTKSVDNAVSQMPTADEQEPSDSQTFQEAQQESQAINTKNDIGTAQVMYIHLKDDSTEARCPWVPDVLEYKLSEDDIPVDMSICIDPALSYSLDGSIRQTVNLLVEREASTQSFLGKLLVAEGIIGRIRSGVYGSDIPAILINGYLAQKDDNGNLHVYNGPYEVTEASQASIDAVELALKGSNASGILLKAVTELRNEQYDLQLDDTYYKWGSIYHYNPDLVSDSHIEVRNLSRVPVSFQFEQHIFYGYWHPESTKLAL